MRHNFTQLFTALLLGISAIFVASCEKSEPEAPAADAEVPVGFLGAHRDGSQIDLEVSLKDEYKLQLFLGNTPGPSLWVDSMNRPAHVRLSMENETLRLGAFSTEFDTTGLQIKDDFSNILPGTQELLIGTREFDNELEPIVLKLVPTTTEERERIRPDQQEAVAHE